MHVELQICNPLLVYCWKKWNTLVLWKTILPPYLVQWMVSIMLPFWTLAFGITFFWLL